MLKLLQEAPRQTLLEEEPLILGGVGPNYVVNTLFRIISFDDDKHHHEMLRRLSPHQRPSFGSLWASACLAPDSEFITRIMPARDGWMPQDLDVKSFAIDGRQAVPFLEKANLCRIVQVPYWMPTAWARFLKGKDFTSIFRVLAQNNQINEAANPDDSDDLDESDDSGDSEG